MGDHPTTSRQEAMAHRTIPPGSPDDGAAPAPVMNGATTIANRLLFA
jgi:hypothetical protein